MSLDKIINPSLRQILVNSLLAMIAMTVALVLSLAVLTNVGHAVTGVPSDDGLTWEFTASEKVLGSGTPELTNWESLIVEDVSDCKFDATLEAARADLTGSYKYEENSENPSTTYTRFVEEEDDGKALCVYSVWDGDANNGKANQGFYINLTSATTVPDATMGGAPGYDNPNAGSKPTEITGAGPQDDFLLGSLLIVGVVASISCAKIWRNYYKLQTSK